MGMYGRSVIIGGEDSEVGVPLPPSLRFVRGEDGSIEPLFCDSGRLPPGVSGVAGPEPAHSEAQAAASSPATPSAMVAPTASVLCTRRSSKPAISCCCRMIRLQVEYQRFFTELSLRPGSDLAISAHLVPSFACISKMIMSSCGVHEPFFSVGSRLLHQRSRHCLPVRPGSMLAMRAQCLPPYCFTSSTSWASSVGHQGPLTFSAFSTFCHLSMHCIAVRPSSSAAISSQAHASGSDAQVVALPRPPALIGRALRARCCSSSSS
mmetsp:Transcript_39608/g.92588  ORF Transcript_39608/g.92588 Transcript_39608/m.92588 type:complete len:264 (-) Transcript_39608:108-899(-)